VKIITPSALTKAISGKKILIDTNVVIYLTDSIEPYLSLSRLMFEMVEAGDVFAVISMMTVAEVMQGPLKKGDIETAHQVREYLLNFPNTICQEIGIDVINEVGKNRRIIWSKLRTLDSVIIASGLVHDVDWIVSNDKHFKKALPPELFLSLEKQG